MPDSALDTTLHPCVRLGGLLRPGGDQPTGCEAVTIDPALLAVAGSHHMVPALGSALAARGIRPADPELAEYLETMHALNARRNRRLMAEVREIAEALAGAGVRPVFLKGSALLLRGVHADPGSRFIGDIDVLVAPGETEAAAAAIEALGFGRKALAPAHVHDRAKLTHPERPAQVELHFPAVPAHLAGGLPPRAMRAEAIDVRELPGAATPTANDLLIHNIIHAMLHDWNLHMADVPMRDALDLVLVARDPEVSWDKVAERMKRVPNGRAALAFYLAAAREAFPWSNLPEVRCTGFAERSLRAWRNRRGRPTGRVRRRLANLVEHSDRAWRRLGRTLQAGAEAPT